MADWRKVSKAFALADGHVSEKEVKILRDEFFADAHISQSELKFLYELKTEAKTYVKALEELIADCEKSTAVQ